MQLPAKNSPFFEDSEAVDGPNGPNPVSTCALGIHRSGATGFSGDLTVIP